MKQKIKEALRQEYKSRLELDDDQLNGVAAFAATFVTDESKIEEFVKSEATLSMLKSYQSMLDKDRAKRKGEGEQGQQGSGAGQQTPPATALSAEAIGEAVAKQMAAIVDPLKSELAQLRAEKTAEQSIATAKAAFFANDWANGYPELRDRAWAQTMRIYEKLGGKMTAEELQTEAMENFKPLAQTQGLAVEKPFEGKKDGSSNPEALVAEMTEVLKASGRIK